MGLSCVAQRERFTMMLPRRARRRNEVLLSTGGVLLEAAMRERPEELAARMAAWEERVKREHEERLRR